MSKPNCYIAGPFFNDAQNELVSKVESIVASGGFEVRSPRKIFICPPDAEHDVREEAFRGNLEEIMNSDLVVSILDYLLPKGKKGGQQNLRVVESRPYESGAIPPETFSPPINIPDQGTLFEIGYAFAAKTPVVGLLTQDSAKMNLMLAQCMHRFFSGDLSIRSFESWMFTGQAMKDVKSGEVYNRFGWHGKVI